MTDYKQTLNLPETEFPMRGNLAKREPDMLASWIAADWHQQIREVQSSREQSVSSCMTVLRTQMVTFTLVMPSTKY